MTDDKSRVTSEGKELGEQMVRLTEAWIAALNAEGEPDERCKSCAFRLGTVPNGCIQTQMDVLKAVVENVPFLCHQHDREGSICHGWFAARVGIVQSEKQRGDKFEVVVPWEFSPSDKE